MNSTIVKCNLHQLTCVTDDQGFIVHASSMLFCDSQSFDVTQTVDRKTAQDALGSD